MADWPRKPDRIKRLLRPFENKPEEFFKRSIEDQKFIVRATFSWLDSLFNTSRTPARFRRKVAAMEITEKIALERKIMRFVKNAIISTPFSWVTCPKNEEWYTYAVFRTA